MTWCNLTYIVSWVGTRGRRGSSKALGRASKPPNFKATESSKTSIVYQNNKMNCNTIQNIYINYFQDIFKSQVYFFQNVFINR